MKVWALRSLPWGQHLQNSWPCPHGGATLLSSKHRALVHSREKREESSPAAPVLFDQGSDTFPAKLCFCLSALPSHVASTKHGANCRGNYLAGRACIGEKGQEQEGGQGAGGWE